MNKLIVPVLLALLLVAFPAHAQRGYGHGAYGHHRGGGSGWAGLAVFGLLSGFAIMAELGRAVYVEPSSGPAAYPPLLIYIEQPSLPVASSGHVSGVWYFCGSSAMYYPYAQACPEGWRTVLARE